MVFPEFTPTEFMVLQIYRVTGQMVAMQLMILRKLREAYRKKQ